MAKYLFPLALLLAASLAQAESRLQQIGEASLPLAERRQISDLSDQFARQIAGQLSREAGLYTAHEMMEALDPNYHSELAQTLLAECERLLSGTAAG